MASSAKIREAHQGTAHTLSERAYLTLLMVWTMLGFASTTWGALITWHSKFSGWTTAGLTVLVFAGTFLSVTEVFPVAMLGYALITFPFGLMLGPVVATYTKASIINVLGITSILSIGLSGVGIIYPKSLRSWGIVLFAGLLLLILGQFGLILLSAFGVPVGPALSFFDWIGIILFSGFIIYDMNQAIRSERTVMSSLGFAVALYLDILNLFIRLLSVFGNKDD